MKEQKLAHSKVEVPEEVKDEEVCLTLDYKVEANPKKGWVPAYHFHICTPDGKRKAGKCDLRIGYNEKLYYGGHIGYNVKPKYRGHHYAAKACRLLFEIARQQGMKYVYITCNPDNLASKRTCELLQGALVEIVDLPEDNDMYQNGERQKCIFRFDL